MTLSSALESCVLDVEEALASGQQQQPSAQSLGQLTPTSPAGNNNSNSTSNNSANLRRHRDTSDTLDGIVSLNGEEQASTISENHGVDPMRVRQVSAASTVLSGYESRQGDLEDDYGNPAEPKVLRGPSEFWAYERARKLTHDSVPTGAQTIYDELPQNQEQGQQQQLAKHKQQSLSIEDLRTSVQRLSSFVKVCDQIVGAIDRGKVLLGDLEHKHETVAEKTSSLHEKCKTLLEEQTKFEKIANEISVPLDFMKELDRLGPLLGLPLPTRLKQAMQRGRSQPERIRPLNPDSPRFFEVLDRVDECIAFIEEHPTYCDYEEYSTKFHQLHLRGLSLIRNLVMDSLEATANSARAGVEAKIEQALKFRDDEARLATLDSEISSLLYIQYFPPQAKQLRGYIEQLEKRVHQKDGADLLLACQKAYCVQRLSLLAIVIPRSQKLRPHGNDLLRTLRVACPYLLNVCRMEYKLFHEFFSAEATVTLQRELDLPAVNNSMYGGASASTYSGRLNRQNSAISFQTETASNAAYLMGGRDAFLDMMSELCGVVYDLVRPLIVKLTQLETLCEAVRVIEGEIIEGQIEALGDAGNAMQGVVIQILQDVQERLIYSTSQYIETNITGFDPKTENLDYPGLLERAAAESTGSGPALYVGCYKTLETTLMCLGLIYRCVEPRTFEELAQVAVTSCALSLKNASERIAAKSTKIDGDLFFIKHLLVLREQISPFNTQLAVKEIELDFSSTTSALSEFLAHSRHIFSRQHNAFVELVSHGVPLVREHEIDCKRDLETQLKQACENFIKKTYSQALAQIIAFLHRASKPLGENESFQDQDFAKPTRVMQLLQQVLESVPEFLGMVRSKMTLYLANAQTESILYKPIQANVLAALTQMTNCIEANYSTEHATLMLRVLASLRTQVNMSGGGPRNARLPSDSGETATVSNPATMATPQEERPIVEGNATADAAV